MMITIPRPRFHLLCDLAAEQEVERGYARLIPTMFPSESWTLLHDPL